MNNSLKERSVTIARIIWRTLLTATGVSGLCINFLMGGSPVELASYYTIQSNILSTGFFIVLLVRELSGKPIEGRWWRMVKCALTMCIMVTFLVYHFMLAPTFAAEGLKVNTSYNIMLHYFVPLGVFFDWVMFDKKGEIGLKEPLYWAAIPVFYLVYTFIYTSLGGRYLNGASAPYFFLDTAQYGVGGVLLWIAAITAGFFALSYLFVGLDRLLAALTNKPQPVEKEAQG